MKRRKKNKPPDVYASAPLNITKLEKKISNLKKEMEICRKKNNFESSDKKRNEIQILEEELLGRLFSRKFYKRENKSKIFLEIENKEELKKTYNNNFINDHIIKKIEAYIKGLRYYL